jgi:carbon monoxide dehydrogenase subunit G
LKVTLERTFPMPATPDVTWGALTDIAGVASCMPGAAITEKVDDRHYKGTVKLKVGPATLSFRGDIEVKTLDAATRTLALSAKGTDTSGTSFASMDLTARVEPDDGGRCNLIGQSEASVGGKAATFGGRMMDAVADQILKQFAANFAARVEAIAPSAPVAQREDAAAATTGTEPQRAAASPSGSAPNLPPAAQPLNGLALLWAVVRDWLRGLFSKKAA